MNGQDLAAAPPGSAALLRTNPEYVLFEDGGDGARLHSTRSGREFKISDRVAEIATCFALPRPLGAGIAFIARRLPDLGPDKIRELIEGLLREGILQRYEVRSAPSVENRAGMFGAPLLSYSDVLQGAAADVAFVGIPYDLGVTHRPGARFGPEGMRRASRALFQYTLSDERPLGAWDPVSGERLLEGVRLCDLGNLSAPVMKQNGQQLEGLGRVVKGLLERGILPVVLGGDHSASLPGILAAAQKEQRLGVVHFDAHSDYGGVAAGDWREQAHHGNFMSWVAHAPQVALLAQIGVRQLETQRPAPCHKIRQWPGRSAVRGLAQVLEALPTDLPYHVSIDVDCLDPSVMQATGTPLPGGFSLPELLEIAVAIASNRHVVSIDVMEFAPGEGECNALVAAEIALRVTAAAMRTRTLPCPG